MRRPTSCLVFGILNIIWAVFGVLGLAFEVARRAGLIPIPTGGNPVYELMETNAGFKLYTDATQIIGAFAIVALLASAIGLILVKPWARVVTVAYGVYSIAMGVLGSAVTYALIFGPLLDTAAGPQRITAVGGIIGAVVGTLINIGYWGLVMFFMTRPHVVAAFTDQFAADSGVDVAGDQPWNE